MNGTNKNLDSGASPWIEQKDVILCRSGKQYYHKSELQAFMHNNPPPTDKDWYVEYRPANVVVKAQDMCKSLPVTKEHPDVWVDENNFSDLAGGTLDKEVSVVALDGESEGEIGIKSNVTFYTKELYDYYKDNKEVSLGYTCKKHWVDNPEEVGYDIVLDEITEVNHLAITRAGRGGSSVAVIDSIIGGMKPMRTGIFAFLKSKTKQTDSTPSSFGKEVLEAVKNSKGTTEEELAVEMKGVLDSCTILKDCEAKDTLMNVVRDCFDHKEEALANEEELTSTLDSMWIDIHSDSLGEIAKAFAKLGAKPEAKTEETVAKDSESEEKTEEKTEDSEAKEDEEKKTEDSEAKEDEEKTEDSEDEKKEEDGCNKDSAPSFLTKEDLATLIQPMVQEAVQSVLGIQKDSKPEVTGGEIDSVNKDSAVNLSIDYSEFLEK